MSLRHAFVSGFADGADATKLRPSDWDADHLFSGGALGSLLFRDTTSPDGMAWLPDVAVGSVLVSGGVGLAPAWSASPALTNLTLSGLLTLAGGASVLSTTAPLTDYSGFGGASLDNAPNAIAGQTSKWIAINDGGITYYIPLWAA